MAHLKRLSLSIAYIIALALIVIFGCSFVLVFQGFPNPLDFPPISGLFNLLAFLLGFTSLILARYSKNTNWGVVGVFVLFSALLIFPNVWKTDRIGIFLVDMGVSLLQFAYALYLLTIYIRPNENRELGEKLKAQDERLSRIEEALQRVEQNLSMSKPNGVLLLEKSTEVSVENKALLKPSESTNEQAVKPSSS